MAFTLFARACTHMYVICIHIYLYHTFVHIYTWIHIHGHTTLKLSILVLQNSDFNKGDGRLTYNERMEEELVDYSLDPLDGIGDNAIFYSQEDCVIQNFPWRWLIFWPRYL